MPEPVTLHRYELMEERRAEERRSPAERRGRVGRDRRQGDRRQGRSLASASMVRRIFPIAEGAVPRQLRRRRLWEARSLAVADALAIVAALLTIIELGDVAPSPLALAAAVLTGLFVANLARLYDRDDLVLRQSTLDETPALLQLSGVLTLLTWLIHDYGLRRDGLIALWAAMFLALFVARSVTRAVVRRAQAPERCLLIGDVGIADHVRNKIAGSRARAEVVAMLPLIPPQDVEAIGGVEGLRAVADEERIDRIIIAPVTTDAADTLELVRVAKLAGVRVSVLPRLFEVIGSSVEFDNVDGMTLLALRRFGLTRTSLVLKRAFDLIGAALVIALLAPLFALIATAIVLDSGRPVFFRQTRVGRDGRRFRIVKFRTMVADAEQRKAGLRVLNEGGDLFKIREDPRVTRVGRFLRRTSLDELPQILNVFRGEMSLVGPRPLVVDEDERVLGLDRARLHLTPGMTGPWQVLGSARVPMREMVGIDYLYVANWSLWTDFKLLLRTLPYMIRGGSM